MFSEPFCLKMNGKLADGITWKQVVLPLSERFFGSNWKGEE